MKYPFPLLLICIVCLSGCNLLSKEADQETVKLLYKNGNLFCEGKRSLDSFLFGTHRNRIGTWKFYHPNGQLETHLDYNQEGDLLNEKLYLEDGTLHVSVTYDDIDIETEYFENGVIKKEITTRHGEDEDELLNNVIRKTYHRNGTLKEQNGSENGKLNGLDQIWNEEGNLILEFKYDDGLIVQ